MVLGDRIRQARLEAGLSQRQLCGNVITRNMLSQIEHGTARPSMDTLTYLASALGRPVSFFLEETVLSSPNQAAMAKARAAYGSKDYAAALEELKACRPGDETFDPERKLLLCLARLALAEQALADNRIPYARQLLLEAGEAGTDMLYAIPELEQRRLLLLAKAYPEQIAEIGAALQNADAQLLLRSRIALEGQNFDRSVQLLEACENRMTPEWQLLRAEAAFGRKDFARACLHFRQAEKAYPEICFSRLEICYRELGDYKLAYEYACRQRTADGNQT